MRSSTEISKNQNSIQSLHFHSQWSLPTTKKNNVKTVKHATEQSKLPTTPYTCHSKSARCRIVVFRVSRYNSDPKGSTGIHRRFLSKHDPNPMAHKLLGSLEPRHVASKASKCRRCLVFLGIHGSKDKGGIPDPNDLKVCKSWIENTIHMIRDTQVWGFGIYICSIFPQHWQKALFSIILGAVVQHGELQRYKT